MPLKDPFAGARGRIPQADGVVARAGGEAPIVEGHQGINITFHRQGAQQSIVSQQAGAAWGGAASLLQPVRRLLAQAAWLGVVVLLRQPRQQLGGQLHLPLPALAVAKHMGPLAQGTPQPFQPGSGGRQRKIPQQRIDPREPQPRLQPGKLPQQPRQQRRPLVLRKMAGQVPHQVGPGVGPLGLQLGQCPAVNRRLGGHGVDAEAAGAGIAGVFVCGGEPAAEGGVVEARQKLVGPIGGIIPA